MESITIIEDNAGTVIDSMGFVKASPNDYVLLDVYVMNDIRYNLYRPKAVSLYRLSKQSKFREFLSAIVNDGYNRDSRHYNSKHRFNRQELYPPRS